ncbi:MAG: ABC transporter substrate-binding protein, partial [Chloroflexi bacterium]|nr:ABC transporter substrate-binding protein [Chloroflexota bacterium]
ATAFEEAFHGLGGEVVAVSVVSKDAADAAAAVAEVAAGDPDGIFFPLFLEAGAAVAQEIAATASLAGVTLISADGVLEVEFLQLPESEGIYIASPSLDFSGNTNAATNESADQLIAVYEQEYGEPPATSYWAHAYDAATLLLTAIEQVAVEVGDRLVIDRAALRQALSETAGFGGLTGALSCDAFGDCGSGGIQIVHHTDAGVTDITRLPVVYRGSR